MASITKTPKGYRAHICVNGKRTSASFRTLREANAWSARREAELLTERQQHPGERITLREVLERYRDEVSPTKRGRRWEVLRINLFLRSTLPVSRPVAYVAPEDLAAWRDERARTVGPNTIIRELALLSSIFEHARRELRLIQSNPVRDVRRPPSPDHREVVITWVQIKAVLRALGHRPGKAPKRKKHAVALAFLLALRTGMRAGEICGLTWDRVFTSHCSVQHKTGRTAKSLRHVPLPPKARRVIERMKGAHPTLVFGIKSASLDAMFRRYRNEAGLEGFTFHDSRHTAATRLAPKIDVLTLCKVFGWSNPKMAMTYYNPSPADIAARLAA